MPSRISTDIRRAVTGDRAGGVVLVGVCSGADHAIESALFEPAAAICVVNPALRSTGWNKPPPPDEARDARPRRIRRADSGAISPDGTAAPPQPADEAQPGAASTDGVDSQGWGSTSPLLSRVLVRFENVRNVSRYIPNWGWWIVKTWFMKGSPISTLEQLTESGVHVVIVAGSRESRRVARGEHRRLDRLLASGDVDMEVVPYLEHSLLERASRDRVGGDPHRLCGDARGPCRPPRRPPRACLREAPWHPKS